MLLTPSYMQCFWCIHRHEWTWGYPWTCDAFPDGKGIPEKLYDNHHIHTTHYPGDNGVLFEPDETLGTVPGRFLTHGEHWMRLYEDEDKYIFDDE